jgi:hypothetical protein
MTLNRNLRIVLLTLFVLSLAIFALLGRSTLVKRTAAQPQESKKLQRWEYCYMSAPSRRNDGWAVMISRGDKQEALDSDMTGAAALNKLGAEGWELVGVSDEVTGQGNQTFTKFFLKRLKY